jgi:hypothetical protein
MFNNTGAMKKMIYLLFTAAIILSGYTLYEKVTIYSKEDVPEAVPIVSVTKSSAIHADETKKPEAEMSSAETVELKNEELPLELNLDVPFYSQAPFGDWSYPWQEACEEASVLLVANAYLGKNWSREEFRDEILKLVDYEMREFGAYEHTNVEQTAKMMTDNFGLKTVIHDDPTYDDIRRILSKGHLIIMTFSGKTLGNPNYTNGGPVYHAMVAKGYKKDGKLIFHDVGTRKGENYVYSWKVIENSLHDWAVPIETGAKKIIEVIPN